MHKRHFFSGLRSKGRWALAPSGQAPAVAFGEALVRVCVGGAFFVADAIATEWSAGRRSVSGRRGRWRFADFAWQAYPGWLCQQIHIYPLHFWNR
jgi:hypothetical protein